MWRAALILTGLWLLPVLLIRAQPYDASPLQQFLTRAEDCPAPCFMGIRPGQTSAEEAVALLYRHAWVRDLEVRRPYELEADSITGVRWQWTEQAPAYIRLVGGYGGIRMTDEMVDTIYFDSTIPLGDLLLAYGLPDRTQAAVTENPVSSVDWRFLEVVYDNPGFSAMTRFEDCPGLSALPDAPATLYIAERIGSRGLFVFDDYSAWPILREVFGCSGF